MVVVAMVLLVLLPWLQALRLGLWLVRPSPGKAHEAVGMGSHCLSPSFTVSSAVSSWEEDGITKAAPTCSVVEEGNPSLRMAPRLSSTPFSPSSCSFFCEAHEAGLPCRR